jgi:hypothetical protein
MTMNRHAMRSAAAAWLLASLSAQAQEAAPAGVPFFNQHLQLEPVVKDAPYAAEAITTVKLTMFDGTKLERSVTAKFYRDSAGRVRREQTVMGLEALDRNHDVRAVVIIVDPVADVIDTIVPGTRTVNRLPMSALRNQPAAPGEPQQPSRVDLGTKDIDGLKAIGYRTTVTIPAGRVGNDKPIDIVDERWESPDLKLLLRSRHHDPRSGDIDYTVTKLTRGEPPRELFVIPAGYTIRTLPVLPVKRQP